jgi:hypothetical protein
VPQGYTFGPLLLNIFINDLCAKIHSSEFLIFADDLKIFHVIKSAEDYKLLVRQSDIDSVQKCHTEHYKKINIFKTDIISFTRKTNINFNYYVGNLLIVRADSVKDLGVMLDSKLNFHRYVDYLLVYSRGLKLLGLIRFIT